MYSEHKRDQFCQYWLLFPYEEIQHRMKFEKRFQEILISTYLEDIYQLSKERESANMASVFGN